MDYKKIFDEAYQKETKTTQLLISMELLTFYSRTKIKPEKVKEIVGKHLGENGSKDLRELVLECIKELENQIILDGKQGENTPVDFSWKLGDDPDKIVDDVVATNERGGR